MPVLLLLWPPSTSVSSWHYVVNECNQVFTQNIFTIIFNKPYFRPSDETFSKRVRNTIWVFEGDMGDYGNWEVVIEFNSPTYNLHLDILRK